MKKLTEVKKIFQLEDTKEVAKALLGHLILHESKDGLVGGYIVDTEAYLGSEDKASHSYGHKNTPRLKAQYDKQGTIYMYSMHTHLLLNLVTQKKGQPEGVMIRGIEPVVGLSIMEELRQKKGPELTNGPGKLTEALGLTNELYGSSIFEGPLYVLDDKKIPQKITAAPRIGIPNKDIWTELPLRYYVAGNPYITKIKKSEIDMENHGWRI